MTSLANAFRLAWLRSCRLAGGGFRRLPLSLYLIVYDSMLIHEQPLRLRVAAAAGGALSRQLAAAAARCSSGRRAACMHA